MPRIQRLTCVDLETGPAGGLLHLTRREIDWLALAIISQDLPCHLIPPRLLRSGQLQLAPQQSLCAGHGHLYEDLVFSAMRYIEAAVDDDLLYTLRQITKRHAPSEIKQTLLRINSCAIYCPALSAEVKSLLVSVEDIMSSRLTAEAFRKYYYRQPPRQGYSNTACDACILSEVGRNSRALVGMRAVFLALGLRWENKDAVITGVERYPLLHLIDGFMRLHIDSESLMSDSWKLAATLENLLKTSSKGHLEKPSTHYHSRHSPSMTIWLTDMANNIQVKGKKFKPAQKFGVRTGTIETNTTFSQPKQEASPQTIDRRLDALVLVPPPLVIRRTKPRWKTSALQSNSIWI